uniref:Uncharacterized protein n=1 Tax=Gadus morhua TaxID=8049 RepID=A0A8C5A4K1_GADMO
MELKEEDQRRSLVCVGQEESYLSSLFSWCRGLEEWSDGRSTPLSVLPQHGDAFVCCVLSHGAEKVVLGVDRKPLPISDITWAFNKEHCPALLGKPKVFFIQACQGHRLQTGLVMDDHPLECDAIDLGRPKVEDGLRVVSIPGEADILVAVATVEKFQAVRHRENGSWFIQSLCEQLREGLQQGIMNEVPLQHPLTETMSNIFSCMFTLSLVLPILIQSHNTKIAI